MEFGLGGFLSGDLRNMVNFDEMVSENFVFTLRNDEFKHERFKNKLIQSIPSNLTKTPQFPPIYQNPSPQ